MDQRIVGERLRAALELFTSGVDMKRRALARAHPEESEGQHRERLARWLQQRDEVVAAGMRERPIRS